MVFFTIILCALKNLQFLLSEWDLNVFLVLAVAIPLYMSIQKILATDFSIPGTTRRRKRRENDRGSVSATRRA